MEERLSDPAARLVESAEFVWHQRFQLAPGVYTPGANDIEWLLNVAQIPADLRGQTVLDIGTTNGGAAFELERRGAERVVAVDIVPPTWFGFAALRELLGSQAEFLQTTVYDLAATLGERFDLVLFWGVLYHLRHPLLALDNLRRLMRGDAFIETAVADHELGEASTLPLVRFYRGDELSQDPSNWFAPTTAGLQDWCWSCGLEPELIAAWPEESPNRCMVKVTRSAGDPEYLVHSYERPLRGTPLDSGDR